MKKILLFTTLLMIVSISSAFACQHGWGGHRSPGVTEPEPYTLAGNDFLSAAGISVADLDLTTSASGVWNITAVYTEAAYTNTYNLTNYGGVLFSNKDESNWDTAVTVDLADTYFFSKTSACSSGTPYALSSDNVLSAFVTTAFTYNSVYFAAGDLLLLFNDGGGDADYDDFVLHGAPTPIPGAIWLLGSGLIGLVGLRRKLTA